MILLKLFLRMIELVFSNVYVNKLFFVLKIPKIIKITRVLSYNIDYLNSLNENKYSWL